MSVILDEGFWERKTRDQMRGRAAAVGALVVMYFLDTPLEKMRERVAVRNTHDTKSSFKISREMFDGYMKHWEPPTQDEEFILA